MRLATHNLAFGYPGKPVGRDVSLTIDSGQILCLLGPNGSGKTTLFKTLLGLRKPQAGDISLDGVSIAGFSRRRLAQALAYVPQAQSAYFPFTVMDTVLMGRTARMSLFSAPSARDRQAAQVALKTLRINELKDDFYMSISSGQRQLVLIARALAQEPGILVMDEPTASLDFGNQSLVLDQIERLSRQGIGIIFSTHDPGQALACANQVAMLHDGRLLRYGAPSEAITRESLRMLYGVDVDVVGVAGSSRLVVSRAIT